MSQHDKESDKTPVVSMNFAYFSSPEAPATTTAHDFPVLIMYCRQTRMVFAHLLPTKSVTEYSVGIVLGVLRLLGYKRFIVKTDQEPSILLLARKAAEQHDARSHPGDVPDLPAEVERRNRAASPASGRPRQNDQGFLRGARESPDGAPVGIAPVDGVALRILVEHVLEQRWRRRAHPMAPLEKR